MERILHLPGGPMNRNDGIATFIMNIYRNIDRKKFQFDFIVLTDEIGEYEVEIEQLGGRIYHVSKFSSNIIKNMIETYRIMKSPSYHIMHRHTAVSLSWPDFFVAKKAGIQIRIAHSHGNCTDKKTLHNLFYSLFERNVTHRFSCGEEAGRWLYRGRTDFKIIKNGINTAKFAFENEVREEQRKLLNINKNTLVIGNIGRLSLQKNQTQLIHIFLALKKRYPNSVLILLGEGSMREDIERLIAEKGLCQNVIMPGSTSEVTKWMSSMDIVVYPSLYEGFPIAVLEGEANGLPSVISDKVPIEIDIVGNIVQIPLEEDPDVWAKVILETYEKYKSNRREEYYLKIEEAGYDIKSVAKEVEQLYDSL